MSETVSTQSSAEPSAPSQAASYFSTHKDLIRAAAYFWIAGATIAYVLHLYDQTRVELTNGKRLPLGIDFLNYWGSSMLAWQGRTDEIYDWHRYYNFLESIVGAPIGPFHYSYPPVLLILTLPFIAFPYVPALAVWLASSWYAFYRGLRLAMPNGGALMLALAGPAVLINAIGGQNGFFTAAFLGGGLCLLQRAPIAAGVLFGLLLYKPHLAILIPVALIAGRQWRAFAAATLTVLVLIAVSIWAFGIELWAAYFERVAALRTWILEDGFGTSHWMISAFVAVRSLGAEPHFAYLIQTAAAVATGAIVALAWWRDAPAPIRYSLLVLGNLLATPYLHDYDLVVCAFVAAWLVGHCNAQGLPDKPAVMAAFLLLALPAITAPFGKVTGFSPGPLFLIPAFIIAARMVPDLFHLPWRSRLSAVAPARVGGPRRDARRAPAAKSIKN